MLRLNVLSTEDKNINACVGLQWKQQNKTKIQANIHMHTHTHLVQFLGLWEKKDF